MKYRERVVGVVAAIIFVQVCLYLLSIPATADTVESDVVGGQIMARKCTVLHGNRVLEVPDKKTLTLKDGVVTFIDVNGNQLWVSQPFIVTVPDQAERRFEQN